MKILIISLISLSFLGCQYLNGDKNLSLTCNGKSETISTQVESNKKERTIFDHNTVVIKIEKGMYGKQKCKFEKDEIFCDGSGSDSNMDWNGSLNINRISGLVYEKNWFIMKDTKEKPMYESEGSFTGVCEESKGKKF